MIALKLHVLVSYLVDL